MTVLNMFLENQLYSWKNFPCTRLRELEDIAFKNHLAVENGVYIFYSSTNISRLKGKSKIIYVGHGQIYKRLIPILEFIFENHSNETKRKHSAKKDLKRIYQDKNLRININVSYCIIETKEKAKELEKEILEEYCKKHIEPPPLNHTRK